MYIVTGGAGFIGSAVVAALNDDGCNDILIVDELGTSISWKNLRNLKYREYVHKQKFIEWIRNGEIPGVPHKSIDGIIHMGACSATTEQDMDYLMENNFQYTKDLAEFCLEHSVRFIYASSAATYGDGSAGYSDDLKLIDALRPLNRYGYSKQLFDRWAHEKKIFNTISGLKFFNVYGPNEYHKGSMVSVPFQAYHQILDSGTVRLFKSYRQDYEDGEQKRDFVYVKDCTSVILWLLSNPKMNGLFNLGTGEARSWNDLARAVFTALDKKTSISYIEMPKELRAQYQYFTEAPMEKLRTHGYTKPFFSLEQGVRDYVQEYLSQPDPYL